MVAAFGLAMFIFGVIFFYIGVSMGWLYVSRTTLSFASTQTLHFQTFMGVLLGSAVVPIALCTTWSKANKWGCISGAILGLIAGIIAWLVTTAKLNPVITVETSGRDYEMLAGNLAAIGVGGIVSVVASYLVSPFSIFPPAIMTQPSFFLSFFFLRRNPRTSTSMSPAPSMPMATITLKSAQRPLPTRMSASPQLRRSARKKQAKRRTHNLLPRARCKSVSPAPKTLIPSHWIRPSSSPHGHRSLWYAYPWTISALITNQLVSFRPWL